MSAAVPATGKDIRTVVAFLDRATPIRVECSWCNGVITPGRDPVSHGICAPCAREHFGIDLDAEAGR